MLASRTPAVLWVCLSLWKSRAEVVGWARRTNCDLSDNPDCRGDVEKTTDSDKCANSGWALWHIPSGGYNHFCCLPGQYGYWYSSLGQNAVGQCSDTSLLPNKSTPAVQVIGSRGNLQLNVPNLYRTITEMAALARKVSNSHLFQYLLQLQLQLATSFTTDGVYKPTIATLAPQVARCAAMVELAAPTP